MLIGREKEVELLKRAYKDNTSHFIAIYGRRRIGKTYLVSETFKDDILFHNSGVANGTYREQLDVFEGSLLEARYRAKRKLDNWFTAFEELKNLIRASTKERKLIFIDELSWMDTPKSDFMKALESFWNGWASFRNDVILIVCASATSWMLKKIIHNKGGLYNRLTEQIRLDQFSLKECEEYFKAKKIEASRLQILQYYMILGGVPYYYNQIERGMSLPQNIDNMFFKDGAPLRDEFQYLFSSTFKNPDVHLKIIEALAKKKCGLTREEIIKEAKLINSGDLTHKLEELESCSFIRKYNCFGRKEKGALYQIMDNFIIFYYAFMQEGRNDEHLFENLFATPTINTYFGFAFERVCLMHIKEIKEKLGIRGVYTEVSSWHCKKDEKIGTNGSQIDLLIVRKDQVINLCEMKYSTVAFAVTDKVISSINNKINDLRLVVKTEYAIYPILLTPIGAKESANALSFQSVVTLDDLFAQKEP